MVNHRCNHFLSGSSGPRLSLQKAPNGVRASSWFVQGAAGRDDQKMVLSDLQSTEKILLCFGRISKRGSGKKLGIFRTLEKNEGWKDGFPFQSGVFRLQPLVFGGVATWYFVTSCPLKMKQIICWLICGQNLQWGVGVFRSWWPAISSKESCGVKGKKVTCFRTPLHSWICLR